jgi:hypothetical protein
MPGGRPTTFTPEIGRLVCELIADGYTLRQIADLNDDLPWKRTVNNWLYKPEFDGDPLVVAFRSQVARARETRAEGMADEITEIADDQTRMTHEHVARDRLRVDTRRWLMSKVLAHKYGDRLDVNHSGSIALEALFQRKDEMKTIEHTATEEIDGAKTVPTPQAIEDKR